MTTKHQAGVLSIDKLKAFKTKAEQLEPIRLTELGINHSGLKKLMAYALHAARGLHIRLNTWTSVEIDLVEDHPSYKIVDVNFLNNEVATHRILTIKVINNNPVSFESVSVRPYKQNVKV